MHYGCSEKIYDQKGNESLQKSNIETEDFKNQINLFTPTNTAKIKTNDKKVIKKKEKRFRVSNAK